MQVKSFFTRGKKSNKIQDELGLHYWTKDSLVKKLKSCNGYFGNEEVKYTIYRNTKIAGAIEEEFERRKKTGWYLDAAQISGLNQKAEEFIHKNVPGYYHLIMEELKLYQVFFIIYRMVRMQKSSVIAESVLYHVCASEMEEFYSGDLDMALDSLVQYQLIRMVYRWENKELVSFLELID